jgi:hypothetical protein
MPTKAIPLKALERLVDAIISDDSLWTSKDGEQYILQLRNIAVGVNLTLNLKLNPIIGSLKSKVPSFRQKRDAEAVKSILLGIYIYLSLGITLVFIVL